MAIKPCRECGESVSTKADTCPNCGAPAKHWANRSQNIGCGGCLVLIVVSVIVIAVVSSVISDAPRTTPVVLADCLDPSPHLLELIESTLEVDGGGSLGQAKAMRSSAHTNAFYVAARINGPGMDGVVGIWATNQLDGSGLIFAVGGMANAFSSLGDGGTTRAAFSRNDRGAVGAERCLG